jgi:PAS domain S-box-containing protein
MSDQSLPGGPDPQLEIAELKRRLQAAEAQLQALQKAPSEVAPAQAEQERSQLFNLSLDLLCVAGFDGMLKQVNPAWTDCLGWSVEELTSRRMTEFILAEDLEATQKVREKIYAGEPVRGFQNRYRCKDGSYRWLSWNVYPVPGEQRVFAVARDVTRKMQIEERLAEQAALLDIAHEAILVKGLDDRIIFWNKGAERTYGWTAAEALGQRTVELFHLEPLRFQEARVVLLEKGEWHGEWLARTKDGKQLNMDSRWTLVRDAQGQPKSIFSINTDITEKKKLEAQFLRSQRMESIGTLAGGMAHDLNNVLAPILMSVGILKEMVTDADGLAMLEQMQGSAQRGADMVRQVLTFARGVSGQRMEVNLGHVLRDIHQVIRETFPKNIQSSIRSAGDLKLVLGDPTQLHQVFMNLCVNARDALPQGGRLEVITENIVLAESDPGLPAEAKPGPYVTVQVSDTGTGIPSNIKDRIFEPFFTTKEFGKGTGLGLSTVMAIVRSHGGFITVASEMGKGTQFKVYLPAQSIARIAEPAPVKPVRRLPKGRGQSVLVVDDEASIREVAQSMLGRYGYEVILAEDGAQAVELYTAHRERIAVVITDMAMPVMDGPATILALRAMNPAVKIIVSSGHASTGGMRHFIPKPYTAELLLTTIAEVINEKN